MGRGFVCVFFMLCLFFLFVVGVMGGKLDSIFCFYSVFLSYLFDDFLKLEFDIFRFKICLDFFFGIW